MNNGSRMSMRMERECKTHKTFISKRSKTSKKSEIVVKTNGKWSEVRPHQTLDSRFFTREPSNPPKNFQFIVLEIILSTLEWKPPTFISVTKCNLRLVLLTRLAIIIERFPCFRSFHVDEKLIQFGSLNYPSLGLVAFGVAAYCPSLI